LAIFCVSRELIFAIRIDWFFLLELIFAIFRKSRSNGSDNNFVFYLNTCNRNAKILTLHLKAIDQSNEQFGTIWKRMPPHKCFTREKQATSSTTCRQVH